MIYRNESNEDFGPANLVGTGTALRRTKSPACDLEFDPVGVGEVQPVALTSGLQSSGSQFLLSLIASVDLDGVAVVVRARLVALEQRQED
jgi:hypothetical protein